MSAALVELFGATLLTKNGLVPTEQVSQNILLMPRPSLVEQSIEIDTQYVPYS
jgi:hypothetical protein